ncbi:hypothetical protein K2173_007111 [Erythroxylum novogranatense]|uniref:Alpha/beta hydrolase fold-3 domain-containing protein n=1 Tax=Erythroxylum novogranatense TaxID=1862640 RepID=A0AAV8SZJ8_9ROSI|nr:hypothetical protein K2173_007111 [Erythroxylum novogranatense]
MADQDQPLKLPPLPWKVKLFVSALSFAVDLTRRSDGSVNRRLMSFFDLKASPNKKPINGIKTTDITVDTTRNLWFRLYTPSQAIPSEGFSDGNGLPVVFFFHGGGFVCMAADSRPYDDFCRLLARELPAFIISVNYRLAPEYRYPFQIDDCFDALKFVDSNEIEEFSCYANLKCCFLSGDSAGGNLVHHVALEASKHKFKEVEVIGNILIQPFFGGEDRTESEKKLRGAPFVTTERSDWTWKSFLPENSDRNHPAANVFGPKGVDMSAVKFPASLVVVGGFDPLQDWQKSYYYGLKERGKEAYLVEYPNAIHTFYAYPELPESSLFIKEMREFVQKKSAAS